MSKHVPPPSGEPLEGFGGLAAAVSPAWHQAIIRLANVSEKVASKLGWILENEQDDDPTSEYVKNCRELVDLMLEFLDGLEEDPDLEPTLGFMNGPAEMDECEEPEDGEPSLASLDRIADQTKWAAGSMSDAELDESDREPDAGELPEYVNEDGDDGGANGTVDDEPSLGSTATINQEAWAFGDSHDREQGHHAAFREEPKPASICNVVPVSGAWWKIDGGNK
jgi:hypothetical protein